MQFPDVVVRVVHVVAVAVAVDVQFFRSSLLGSQFLHAARGCGDCLDCKCPAQKIIVSEKHSNTT